MIESSKGWCAHYGRCGILRVRVTDRVPDRHHAHDSVIELIEQRLSVDSNSFAYAWAAGAPELRRDPRFEMLARRIGLPAYWRDAGFPPQCRAVGGDGFACE